MICISASFFLVYLFVDKSEVDSRYRGGDGEFYLRSYCPVVGMCKLSPDGERRREWTAVKDEMHGALCSGVSESWLCWSFREELCFLEHSQSVKP